MKIILLGPHGAGKSTQAHLLAAALHLPYISTGEMLRALQTQSTPLAAEIRRILAEGQYLSDEHIIELVRQRLSQHDVHRGFILEGFPRTKAQAEALDEPIDLVFHLALSDEESARRLLARQRAGDTPEIIRRRLEKHHAEVGPILSYYRQQGLLQEIDASREVQAVHEDLLQRIHAYDRNQND